MWTPGASAANGGSGHLIDEVAGFSVKVRRQKGGRSISREPENQAEEERSDLAFATIMFRALGHIVLRSTKCSVHYYSIVAVDKNLGLVEAQNFVPYIWAPGTEGGSGATGYFGSLRSLKAGFLLWERESERGKEVVGPG